LLILRLSKIVLKEVVVPLKITVDGKIIDIQIHDFANASFESTGVAYSYEAQIQMAYTRPS